MNIGIPKEIKNNENRVSLTPDGTKELINNGHKVYIQSSAGLSSGFNDDDYTSCGAEVLNTIEDVYKRADMIVKVKEPIEAEYALIRKNQVIFTFFHFAASESLTLAMIEREAICIAYETVEKLDKSLPILTPMSEVAGRMSIQQGAKFLEKPMKGRGILLGGVPGVPPAKVMIIGGGVVGTEAAKMAAGLGADVSILDINLHRLRHLNEILPANVRTIYSSTANVERMVQDHDLIIGAVLIPGAKAPKMIKKGHLTTMRPGTVLVDVAVDQGGCFETTHATTHQDPIYVIDDVVHYCVANMPGAVPYTSTQALSNATLAYIIQLANKGWKKACIENNELKLGLNIIQGKIVYQSIATTFGLKCISVDTLLN